MRWLEEAARILNNQRAKKENGRRGQEDLQRREVEALERIADAMSPAHRGDGAA
jgi:hypothetical protein